MIFQLNQDLRKTKVDLFEIHNFLSAQVMGYEDGSCVLFKRSVDILDEGSVAKFVDWIGNNAREMNPQKVDEQLHSSPHLLQKDERVELAFQSGRDMIVYTSKRILVIDRQGITGTKISYLSLPLKSCKCFDVESAGSFDRDDECHVYSEIPDLTCVAQDLRKCDIFELQAFLGKKILS